MRRVKNVERENKTNGKWKEWKSLAVRKKRWRVEVGRTTKSLT